MTHLHLRDLPADRIEAEVAVSFFFEDERPLFGHAALLDWRLNGCLTDMLVRGRVSGRAGEQILVRNNGKLAADWVLFAGGGNRRGLGEGACREMVRRLLRNCRQSGFSRIALCLDPLPGADPDVLAQTVDALIGEMGGQRPECQLSFAAPPVAA